VVGNNAGLESRFEDGRYVGYEVRLVVERSRAYRPHKLNTPSDIYGFMSGLSRESSEHVYQLLLDAQRRVTSVYLVGKGGIDQSPCVPLEVYKAALVTNSPAFALVHNHPSGVPEPSPDDMRLAERVRMGADLLGLEFVDFIVIGSESYCSLRERGAWPLQR
jgi:DNA repair protein RadC